MTDDNQNQPPYSLQLTLCPFSAGAYFLDGTLYVLFTGSNSIVETGSVLCSYSMDEIEKAFASNYKVSYIKLQNEFSFSLFSLS